MRIAQLMSMVRISGHSFESVSQQLAQGTDVFVGGAEDPHLLRFDRKLDFVFRFPEYGIGQGSFIACMPLVPVVLYDVAHRKGGSYLADEAVVIEISIRNRCKQGVHRKNRQLTLDVLRQIATQREECHPFKHIDEQVLQVGYVLRLSANTGICTTCSAGCLLALVTEHGCLLK
ncbi:hypothetical protein D3C74_302590 [compost metagenome]